MPARALAPGCGGFLPAVIPSTSVQTPMSRGKEQRIPEEPEIVYTGMFVESFGSVLAQSSSSECLKHFPYRPVALSA